MTKEKLVVNRIGVINAMLSSQRLETHTSWDNAAMVIYLCQHRLNLMPTSPHALRRLSELPQEVLSLSVGRSVAVHFIGWRKSRAVCDAMSSIPSGADPSYSRLRPFLAPNFSRSGTSRST